MDFVPEEAQHFISVTFAEVPNKSTELCQEILGHSHRYSSKTCMSKPWRKSSYLIIQMGKKESKRQCVFSELQSLQELQVQPVLRRQEEKPQLALQ